MSVPWVSADHERPSEGKQVLVYGVPRSMSVPRATINRKDARQ